MVAEELAGLTAAEEGRLAVIAPAARQAELAAAIPGAVAGDRAEALDAPVALLTVAQAKGLEFEPGRAGRPGRDHRSVAPGRP